jgi:hypothetical protein
MRNRVVGVGFIALLVVAGCGQGATNLSGPELTSVSTTTVTSPTLLTADAVTALSSTDSTVGTEPSASESTTEPSTTTVQTSSATSAVPEPIEKQLAARVRGLFAARRAANAAPTPNPESPQLADFASGEALASLRDETATRRDQGQAIRASTANAAQVRVGFVKVTGTTATVSACSVDDGVILVVATSAVVNDSVMTNNYRVELAQLDGVWKVTSIMRLQQWEGVAGCAKSGDYPY